MSVLTALMINGIGYVFVDTTKDGVSSENISIADSSSVFQSSASNQLEVQFILQISLPKSLHNKFVNTADSCSRLMARVFLTANFEHCVLNEETNNYELLDGENELSLTAKRGHSFELLQTLSVKPYKDGDTKIIYLTERQKSLIEDNVLCNINVNSKQAVLDAVIVALNIEQHEPVFCDTLLGAY